MEYVIAYASNDKAIRLSPFPEAASYKFEVGEARGSGDALIDGAAMLEARRRDHPIIYDVETIFLSIISIAFLIDASRIGERNVLCHEARWTSVRPEENRSTHRGSCSSSSTRSCCCCSSRSPPSAASSFPASSTTSGSSFSRSSSSSFSRTVACGSWSVDSQAQNRATDYADLSASLSPKTFSASSSSCQVPSSSCHGSFAARP